MQQAPVGLSVRQHIPEEQRIARLALVAPIELRKVRLSALEILTEIDEESEHALAIFGDLPRIARLRRVEEIVMRKKLLAGCVMEHRAAFHGRRWRTGEHRNACPHEMKDEAGFGEVELRRAVGAVAAVSRRTRHGIVSPRELEKRSAP